MSLILIFVKNCLILLARVWERQTIKWQSDFKDSAWRRRRYTPSPPRSFYLSWYLRQKILFSPQRRLKIQIFHKKFWEISDWAIFFLTWVIMTPLFPKYLVTNLYSDSYFSTGKSFYDKFYKYLWKNQNIQTWCLVPHV